VQERRIHLRHPITAKISIWGLANHPIEINAAKLHNVGNSGFAFMAEEELIRGVEYRFQIEYEDKNFNLKGKVVHRRNQGNAFSYGVKITSLSFFKRGSYREMLAQKSGRFRFAALALSLLLSGAAWAVLHFVFGINWGWGLATMAILVIISFLLLPF